MKKQYHIIRKKIKYFLLYLFVKTLLFLSKKTPRIWWIRICGWLGNLSYLTMPKLAKQTVANLTIAYKNEKNQEEIKKLSSSVFTMIGKNAGDLIRSFHVRSLKDLNVFLTTHGLSHFEQAHAKKKGVIFITAHLGAFDLQVTNMALRGFRPHIIGKALKDKKLNRLLYQYRKANGAIPIERGKESVRLYKALKAGESIAILIDQDTNVKSVFTDFFGHPAHTPIGAAILALRSGAAVVPTYVYMDSQHQQHMHILPELQLIRTGNDEHDIHANTQLFTSYTEKVVRLHPEQWVWMHERWKTKK